MKIRKMEIRDVSMLADLWLKTSLTAHSFIPEKYWIENKILMVEKYLPNSEVYVAEEMNNILGFVALIENQIASIFVDERQQGKGIGSLLLDYVKDLRSEMTLNVYQKNQKSVNFYKTKGFNILEETIDEPTGEKEFKMQWNKNVE
ncbi:N-acetyltransferase [Flavobacterium sp. I3-2]|uniref:N-acetyltransferase n=1 Tax=Flavobacterium sp. I3-2 TaxID=2748319 RepID=UPI0015B0C5F3|nr:N-acetyltransferase [Flavobacterium sp. I3-2]